MDKHVRYINRTTGQQSKETMEGDRNRNRNKVSLKPLQHVYLPHGHDDNI